jgi:hypothetical protein
MARKEPVMADQGGSGQDPFEMFRRLWAPLGVPVPGMAMPTLDPAEVEKRITDLKSVETWLGMNLNMVKMAIQGLEVQKMALNAMKANAGAATDAANAFATLSRGEVPGAGQKPEAAPDTNPLTNPMMWPWAMMQGVPPQQPAETKQKPGKDRKDK